MLADHAIAWMLTYLLHSTLLLGLAWLVSKPLSRWSVAAEETVWKLSLVGAVLTASLQLAIAWEPAAGRWELDELSQGAAQAVAVAEPAGVPALPMPPVSSPVTRRMEIPAEAPAFRLSLPPVTSLALGAWGLGAALLMAAYGAAWLRLRRRLRVRPRVVGGTMFSELHRLTVEAGILEDVHLSCSSRVPVPLALGLRRHEICVPPRALAGLTREQQEGMLAHELAHLVRRDPFWLVLSHTVACVLFFQPLNWVARRRLREISEMLSDEWAVNRTGRPLSLAGCLAEVAGWSSVRRALPVPGMADRPSHLAQRIRRLLDKGRSPERPLRRVFLGAAMAVLVIAVAAAAPAISANGPEMPEPADAPDAPMMIAAADPADPADAPEPPRAPEREDAKPIFDEEKFERDFEARFEEDFTAEFMEEFEKEFEFDEEFEFEFEFPHEFEHEFEYDFDTDAIVASAMAAVDGALAGSVDWGQSGHRELTPEEEEKLERDMERISEEVERSLKPQQEKLERLSREISEKVSRMNTGEMERLASEMAKLAERMHPSEEEMARFQAQMRKYGDERRLTDEEREQVRREAREMARKMRPSDEDRKRMQELREEMRKHQAEMRRLITDEDRAQMRKAQEEMRRAIELHSQSVRDQVRRSMDEQRLQLREEDRERREERKQRREEDRERQRDREDHDDPSGPSY